MTDENVLIRIEDLKKAFGSHVVLDGISTDIHVGEKVVIIGPSGSGKSTFLRCMNLLETPTSGRIWFDGEEITSDKRTSIWSGRKWAWYSSISTCFPI